MSQPFTPDVALLQLRGSAQASLHQEAACAARQRFGPRVFVRAVVEVSNFCRENCAYCGMRRANRNLARYRAAHEPLAELLLKHLPSSVTDINIQAGEDPVAVRETVLPLLRTLRRETALGLSVCLGTLDAVLCNELQAAGASLYIIKFETADPLRYATLQAPGKLSERLLAIRQLADSGWHVSSGFIAGLPEQSPTQLLANLTLADTLPLSGCSVSPFIPGDETPLAGTPLADLELTLNTMASLRLMRPDWVIPAVSALNLAGQSDGYSRGLRTGANLVTINLTPENFRDNYLLYKRDRVIMNEERILSALASEGLSPSKQSLADFFRANRPVAHLRPPTLFPNPA